ncbi:MAG: ABC transporter substrate-binding protein/permease [Acholeplasma sp.]|nr:ABC transporter substrate-binding protein/permease [Acholeplasma sp.]
MKKLLMGVLMLVSLILLSSCSESNSVYEFVIDDSYDNYIVLGTSADYPPYEWPMKNDGKSTVVGIDIELAKEIAKATKNNLRVINKGFDFLLEDLREGKVDFVLSGMNPTDSRKEIVDFSNIYYYASHAIMIHKDNLNTYNSIIDLNNAKTKIGAQLGSIQQELVDTSFPLSVKQYLQAIPDLIMQLDDKSIDALVIEEPVAKVYSKKYQDLVILDALIGNENDGSAAAVKKGNNELLTIINQVIAELKTSGQLDKIILDAVNLNESSSNSGSFSFLLESHFIVLLLKGLLMTIILAVLSVGLGSVLGFFIALMKLSDKKYLSIPAKWYIDIIRGTPLLVQVLLIYSFIQLPVSIVFGIDLSNFIPGMIALLINSSAYVSEIIRGGILAVDKGQKEAALSLGMTNNQVMKKIILPQAIKNIIPSLGNEFVTMIKETSIFMYLGVAELMYSAQIVKTETYQVKEVYIVVAILYLVLTLSTSKIMSVLEKRLRVHEQK